MCIRDSLLPYGVGGQNIHRIYNPGDFPPHETLLTLKTFATTNTFEPRTQNTELRTQNSEHRTQNSELKHVMIDAGDILHVRTKVNLLYVSKITAFSKKPYPSHYFVEDWDLIYVD